MLNRKRISKVLAILSLVAFMGTTTLTGTIEAASPRPPMGNSQGPRPTNNSRPAQNSNRPAPPPNNNRHPEPPKHSNHRHPSEHSDYRGSSNYRRSGSRRWDRERESHSDTGNLVTGLIIGGIIGAVIANNS